jgi:23S rRNA (adenine2503-C2)-methyltransferase
MNDQASLPELPDIRALSDAELEAVLVEWGEKPFRARQVSEWIWSRAAGSFAEMTNLSKGLRDRLSSSFALQRIALVEKQVSADRTIKCAFEVAPGKVVEGVLIPTRTRMTACISSQVGCSLACTFCATGKLKLMKNLSAGEIYDQVEMLNALALQHYGIPLSNIVFMGMGEPLLNYSQVLEGIARITGTPGLGISPQRITVSTAGIAKAIQRLADDGVRFHLALSLHAADDAKRNEIMAINQSNSLEVLAQALRYFHEKTGDRVTFEYIIFKDFNDGLSDARALARFCRHVPCKINIIEYNPIDGGSFEMTTPERLEAFVSFLEGCNLVVNVRRSRGKDIDAACGQLANKNEPGALSRVQKPQPVNPT